MTAQAPAGRRAMILTATPMLAERIDPLTTDMAALAQAAGVPQAEFEAEFGTLENYFAAVQLQFFEGRLASVIGLAGTMKPGMERIRNAWTGYLDYSVEHAAVLAWCRRARQRFPSLHEELRRRNHGVLLMIQIEFSTLRCAHPMERARLAVGMVLETAKMETEARAKNYPMRSMLWSTLELLGRT